ncbi:MAG: hypothetical protein ACSHWQ_01740 [Spongiibacteraceae bacterium]
MKFTSLGLACVLLFTGAQALAAEQQANGVATFDTAASSWGLYNRHGAPVTPADIARARGAEKAVAKAGVPVDSQEAAMIRIGAGERPEWANEPNDGVYDAGGKALSDSDAAEEMAIAEVVRRSGAEPGSEREAMIRAAAKGEPETADGDAVDEQTIEEVAKEVAVQQAVLYTGAQSGSSGEAMIKMGADVFMDKIKSWWN